VSLPPFVSLSSVISFSAAPSPRHSVSAQAYNEAKSSLIEAGIVPSGMDLDAGLAWAAAHPDAFASSSTNSTAHLEAKVLSALTSGDPRQIAAVAAVNSEAAELLAHVWENAAQKDPAVLAVSFTEDGDAG